MSDALERIREQSQRLVEMARGIQVLGRLTWPSDVVDAFVEGWHQGKRELPVVAPPSVDLSSEIDGLEGLLDELDLGHPLGRYLAATAASYLDAARLVSAAGTRGFLELSRNLYGDPSSRMPGTDASYLDAAQALLDATGPLAESVGPDPGDYCLTAEHVRRELQQRIDGFFTQHQVEVVIDESLASKAAASATRIRIRGRTCFSDEDLAQLLEHEAFVHSATALNGRAQPLVDALGLGAPRTTATQEGLATLAEVLTGAIDLARLRRLALRTVAVHNALDGADFIDTFRFFLEQGQTEMESVRSAMRVFRGGDLRGRVVFTKDAVYLHGLFSVHTFFRKAIAEHRVSLVRRVFAGRLSLADVLDLEEAFEAGWIREPLYVPRWAASTHTLAATLAFSRVVNRIDLEQVGLHDLNPVSVRPPPVAPRGGE
ncbi:MAG: DUF1704 domain-containing protein [Myxococcales bacterium]|nr:DUF1704 domain-containing protein [Myxococcales bacterium]